MNHQLETLQPYLEAGAIGQVELVTTEAALRVYPSMSDDCVLAYALAVRAPIWGHVCVDLATVSDTIDLDDPDASLSWPVLDQWLESLKNSDLVRSIDGPAQVGLKRWPLVLDGTRLYTDRYATYESMVAEAILSRIGNAEEHSSPEHILDGLFPSDPTDKQRQAALLALTSRITIILGGPGTGKTRTVARLLAAVTKQILNSEGPLEIALTAPTGKAAARMTDAVRNELNDPAIDNETASQLLEAEATTIHRLLGYAGSHRFHHDRHNPLPYDLIIVDETSMVSLPLMARLFDALSPEARIVLVGDPYQLASVEAGAVLGDISRGAKESALGEHTVVLDRVHRFASESGIAALADSIKLGDFVEALRLLKDDSIVDIELISPSDASAIEQVRKRATEAADQVISLARSDRAQEAIAVNNGFKLLSAARQGPFGVADWTERISTSISSSKAKKDQYDSWYTGRPVMASQNDYMNNVFNGDIGIVIEKDNTKFVALPTNDGVRLVPVARMASVTTWWAMTIHKSQGSEFSEVVLSLPGPESRIMTRELLYTGVTRAKERVTIIASEEALRSATSRLVQRSSGLSSRMTRVVSGRMQNRSQ